MQMTVSMIGALLLAVTTPIHAQDRTADHHQMAANDGAAMGSMRMIMPTNDEKVFRLVRPVVAALQVKLAEVGLFAGRLNGLYGPSTREAIMAYQAKEGLELTSLPDLNTALSLLGMEPADATNRYAGRIDMQAAPEAGMQAGMAAMAAPDAGRADAGHNMDNDTHQNMDMHQMGGRMEHARSDEVEAEVAGDPGDPKSLMLMTMPGMVMENRHSQAVRAFRELVAAVQIKLAERGGYDGTIDGLPASPASREALETYQRTAGLEVTGQFDFPTALTLFGLVPTEVEAAYAARLDLRGSPVGVDRDLMESSSRHGWVLIEPGDSGSPTQRERMPRLGQESAADTLEIEVRMNEFSFSPDPLEIPAGQPVRLVIRNVGKVAHEFMGGREPQETDFEHDLFAGVTVDIRSAEEAAAHGEHEHEAREREHEADEQEHEAAEHEHEAEQQGEMEGMHGEGHGGGHGTMVMVDPEKITYMTFTLPASKRGEWSMACFVPGHFAAGMHGTLVVK